MLPPPVIFVVMQANLVGTIKSHAPAWQLISCRGQAGISFLFQGCTLSKSSSEPLPRISKCFTSLIMLHHTPVKSVDERTICNRAVGKLRHQEAAASLGHERQWPLDLEEGELSIPAALPWGFCRSNELAPHSQQSGSLTQ